MPKTALIAMSGGVDSAVAAACMVEAGYTCTGVMLRLHDSDENTGVQDAAAVCARLGIPFQVLDWREAFRREVIGPFIAAYEAGRTPNPCITCNRTMKFGGLHRYAAENGFDVVVTGHYARIVGDDVTGYRLCKATNRAKDQSYVLYNLTPTQLAHTLFPLGEFPDKEAAREVARRWDLPVAHKGDSQDICFIPDGKYAEFIRRTTGRDYPVGDFVDRDGRILGQHKGLIGYTIGQRKGLGLALPAPLYVRRKCVEDNTVLLTPESELYTTDLVAEEVNWLAGEAPVVPLSVTARTRYSAKEMPAVATSLPGARMEVVFETPQRAVTEGQAVVLYVGDTVIGGGTICEA